MKNSNNKIIPILFLFAFTVQILLSCYYLEQKVICKTGNGNYLEYVDINGNCEHNLLDNTSNKVSAFSGCEDIQFANHLTHIYQVTNHNNYKNFKNISASLIDYCSLIENSDLKNLKYVNIKLISYPLIIKSTTSLLI